MIQRLFAATVLLAISFTCLQADEKIIGNPNAPQGGLFKYNLGQAPTTLNPLSSTDYYATQVQNYIVETLLVRNADTYEWESNLAKDWSVSKDGKAFEFTLREGAKWHDGKPVTIEDVKFSFDAIVHPKNKYKTAHLKPYYENIEKAEIIGENKIRFTASQIYFGNFNTVAGLSVLPKHVYENPTEEQEKELNKTIVGSGPYTLDNFRRGNSITLKANENWWGKKVDKFKGIYNFDRILMRFISESTVALQRLVRGDLDFQTLSSEDYVRKAVGPQWGKRVHKEKIQNKAPQGYNFIGWNMENPLFKSKKVRKALYHLVNRAEMIEKFRYDMSKPATGPLYQQSVYADPDVEPIEYSPKKAKDLFKEEGWKPGSDGILQKEIDGEMKKMSFTIIEPNQEFERYLTMFQQHAKKQGVDVNVRFLEWNSFIQLLNERKFEAVRLGWSGGAVDWDPKQIWHSESANASGSNFINYSNPKVDKLIDESRKLLDKEKRIKKLREVYRLIAEDVPYVFLFNDEFSFYGHTDRMGREKDTYNYTVGTDYWWIKK
jgi:peptide/nickel transport system substrate-binding protein/microcin C transport system substrate-binding protein